MHVLRIVNMTFYLNLFALSYVCAHPKLLMTMNGIHDESSTSSTSFRPRLEEVGAIEFPFQFWKHFDKDHIR